MRSTAKNKPFFDAVKTSRMDTAQDGSGKTRGAARRVIEKQRRFGEFELEYARTAVVGANQVDAGVCQFARKRHRIQRVSRKLQFCGFRRARRDVFGSKQRARGILAAAQKRAFA